MSDHHYTPIDNDNQTLSLAANQLAISGGNSVDLAPYLDNTDAQVLAVVPIAGGVNLQISNGNTVFIPDDTGSDDQLLSLIGNTITIENGNSIDLSAFLDNTDNQVLTLAGNSLELTSDDGTDTIDLSPYLDNTDSQILSGSLSGTDLILNISGGNSITIPLASIDTDDQTLSLVGNTLAIADGNSVNLAPFLDNTDNQVLSLAGNVLTLTSDDGADTVNLSTYLDNTDAQILTANLTGTDLVISISNGNTVTVPLGSIDTDDQTLSLLGNSLTIADGNTVDLSQFEETLNTTTVTKLVGFAGGVVSENGTQLYGFNAAAGNFRNSVGNYTVNLGAAHSNGANYIPVISVQSDSPNRDQRKISWLNRTPTSFDVIITVDDNGTAADGFADEVFSWYVPEELIFIQTATLT